MFSMLWLYSAAFCNSIASIAQKLGTWTDPYMQFFFLGGGSKCTVQREQDKPILACLPGEADQNTGFTS